MVASRWLVAVSLTCAFVAGCKEKRSPSASDYDDRAPWPVDAAPQDANLNEPVDTGPPLAELTSAPAKREWMIGDVTLSVTRPKFTSSPETVGRDLNTAIEALVAAPFEDALLKTMIGSYIATCELTLATRLQVSLRCTKSTSLKRKDTGTTLAIGGDGPITFGYAHWLTPGLPKIALADLLQPESVATVRAMLDKANDDLGECTGEKKAALIADAFLMTPVGLEWLPAAAEYTVPTKCLEKLPKVAFTALTAPSERYRQVMKQSRANEAASPPGDKPAAPATPTPTKPGDRPGDKPGDKPAAPAMPAKPAAKPVTPAPTPAKPADTGPKMGTQLPAGGS